jgi:hypothetical protein
MKYCIKYCSTASVPQGGPAMSSMTKIGREASREVDMGRCERWGRASVSPACSDLSEAGTHPLCTQHTRVYLYTHTRHIV